MKFGAYGFRLVGVDASDALVPAPDAWPELRLEWREEPGGGPALDALVGPGRLVVGLQTGGSVVVHREPLRAEFRFVAMPPPPALIHPYLAPAAAVAAHWLGRLSFHAGAVVADGGAWVVMGDKGAGKSTALAHLAARGQGVLADDVVVVDLGAGGPGPAALAGPRTVDLRAEGAAHLGVGEPLGRLGTRERFRAPLGPVPAAVPLRGWVQLAWGERAEVVPVRGAARLGALLTHRVHELAPAAVDAYAELSELPVLELRRPRDWASLDAGADALLAAIGG